METTTYVRNKYILGVSILVICIGALIIFKLNSYQFNSFSIYTVNIVPGLLLFFSWWLKPYRPLLSKILTFLSSLGVGLMFVAYLGIIIFLIPTVTIYDTEKYREILKSYDYPSSKFVSHFPQSIPQNAKKVRFVYQPPFLQGGAEIQLRYTTTLNEINELFHKYNSKAKIVRNGSEGGIIDISIINQRNNEFDYLPTDYKVLILNLGSYKPNDWNHGFSYGLAVSKKDMR